MTPLYAAILRWAGPVVRRYHRLTVLGAERLPPPGQPALLACNHPGCLWWDGFCIAFGLPDRHVRFIAHYWDDTHFSMRFFLVKVGARFLDRSLAAISQASPVVGDLRKGALMAQFPEESYHTFRDRYTLFRFSPQIIRYAQLGDAPIFPTAVIGVEEACPTFVGYKAPRRPLHIPYHPPFLFPARVTVDIGGSVDFETLTGRARHEQLSDAEYTRAADRLRELVRDRIARHRACAVRDLTYNQHRSWY